MPDATVTALRDQLQDLRAALHAPDASARREVLKGEIIALYRAIEREMVDLATLKDDVKGLVQHWKALEERGGEAIASVGAPLPGSAPERPAPEPTLPSAAGVATAAAAATAPEVIGTGAGGAAPAVSVASAPGDRPTRTDHLNASTYLEKGWSLMSLGDHAGAEAALTRALELAPNDPHGESLLGWAQMLQDKYDDALLNFQKVLMREPQNSLARINVGYICLKKKIFGEAIEHLSKAIRLDNDRKATLYAHYYLGLLYLEREMYEDAQNFLRKAIGLGPNLIEAYYELGRAIFFAGDREGAMTAWRDGARANKFNPWGKRCAELLQHVESGGAPPRST